MPTARRLCEMKIPESLVEKMEKSPEGIGQHLSKIEREFGLKTSSSYIGHKQYVIIGPNPEIIELALETLQHRFFAREEKESDVIGDIEDKRAVWKLQGDYATKAGHLFKVEIEQLRKIKSVQINIGSVSIEITCGLDDVEQVKTVVDSIQTSIDGLQEEDILLSGPSSELVRLKSFMKRKHKYDRTVVCIWNDKLRKLTIFGRTEMSVRKAVDEWTLGKQAGDFPFPPSPRASASPRASYVSQRSPLSVSTPLPQCERFQNELKIPGGIVAKLKRNRNGMNYIISRIEKEFGLKVVFTKNRHLTIFGPHLDILEMAAQTIVHRYVIKTPPEHGVIGTLQGKNAVWKFIGSYAKIIVHLFRVELKRLERIRTVTVKTSPSRQNPNLVEVLCSVRVIEIVKAEVEKIVGLIHHLFQKEIVIPDDVKSIEKTKDFVRGKQENDTDNLCLFDEHTLKLTIYGRNEMLVWQAVCEVQNERKREMERQIMPDEFWQKNYRQLYKTKIANEIVEKLELEPGGIMPMIQRIEKEYGVKTIYHRQKQMVLIAASAEVLELAQETLESRYVTDGDTASGRLSILGVRSVNKKKNGGPKNKRTKDGSKNVSFAE